MNFASKAFLIFLPIVLLSYHLLPSRTLKYRFLLVASWLFYAWAVPQFLWVILFTSLVDYLAGLWIGSATTPGRRKAWLIASLIANLGLLAFFKYTAFLFDNFLTFGRFVGLTLDDRTWSIVLPLGISFHTFQGISYTIDVYRGKIAPVRSFTDFALFVAFFPQLVAGPIVRAVEFLPQLGTPPRVTSQQIIEGLHWFLLGLFKKVFIADRLGQHFVDPVFANPLLYDAETLRWAILAYAAQIYCDFAGYSDMAIGCAKWFGFEFPKNFNYPYISRSITEFWARWHMTLGTWLRDYVYISLGGNRVGTWRLHFNLILTFTLCGLWHGASWNYVAWGFFNGVLLSLHRVYDSTLRGWNWASRLREGWIYALVAWATTLWLFLFGLIFVRCPNWTACWHTQLALAWLAPAGGTHWLPVWVPALIGLVAMEHLAGGLWAERAGLLRWPSFVRAMAYAGMIVLCVTLGPGMGKPFIYFQF